MDEPISITFFLPSLECGGAERNAINLLNNINREKFKISVLLAEKKGDFLVDIPVDIKISEIESASNLKIFFYLIKYFKKGQTRIFVCNFPRFNAITLLARMIAGGSVKIIIIEHLSIFLLAKNAKTYLNRFLARFVFPYFVKIFYPQADKIICVSRGIADELFILNAHLKNIDVVYNPVANSSIGVLANEAVDHEWFTNYGIPVITMVGRLVKTKDQATLILALKIILKSHNVRLALVGGGPEEGRLKKITEDLGLVPNIAFLGFQKNPYKYIKRSSVFVLSSLQEGFGNVIVEAMACGIPVVSSNCKSGPNEIINNGINGFLVPVKNPEALAKAILKVINNPSLAKKLSEEGVKRAKDFSIEESAKGYEKIFEKLI